MKKTIALFLAITTVSVFSAEYDPVGFTQAEIERHDSDVDFIVADAATCLKEKLYEHRDFHKKWGISPFYGDQSKYAKLIYANGRDGEILPYREQISARRDYLRGLGQRLGRNFPDDMVDKIKPTSCIGLALQCLREGFHNLGEQDIWEKVNNYTSERGVTGGALQHALQELGWKILYWNPNTNMNNAWDRQEEVEWTPESRFRGQHSYVYNVSIKRHRKYYLNRVDNTKFLVNFGKRAPERFNKIPFFLGVAHLGYHVFPGFYGEVIEGHSTRPLTDYYTLETGMLNPLHGGSPKATAKAVYRSGVIAIPPHHIGDDEGPDSVGDSFMSELVDYLWFND